MVELPQTYEIPEKKSSAFPKFIILIFLTSLSGFLTGYFFAHNNFLYGLFATLVFLSFFVLEVILFESRYQLLSVIFFNALGIALAFYKAFSFYFIFAFLVFLIFLFLGAHRGKRETENTLKIAFFRVARAILSYAMAAVFIFLVVAFILSGSFSLNEKSVSQTIDALFSPLAKHYLPDFRAEMRTDNFLYQLALRNLALGNNTQAIPGNTKRTLINQSAAEVQQRIEGLTGTKLDLQKSVGENIYQILRLKIKNLSSAAKVYWTLTAILLILISIKSVEFILYLPIALLAFLIYELFLALGITATGMESTSREVVFFK